MLITFDHPQQISSEKNKPQLLFLCRAMGEADAIPRLMHSHQDRLEIIFIYKGCGNYIIDGESYQVKAGDLLVFNADSIHDEQPLPSNDLVIYSCGVANLKIGDLPLNHIITKQQKPVINTEVYSEEFKQFFELLLNYTCQKNQIDYDKTYYITLSFLLLTRDIFKQQTQPIDQKKISLGQRIKDFLDRYYLDGIDISSISEALNVNRHYLSQVFKTFSGYSPKQYIIRRRIGEAQSLLLNTNYSLVKVANRLG